MRDNRIQKDKIEVSRHTKTMSYAALSEAVYQIACNSHALEFAHMMPINCPRDLKRSAGFFS
jgi:hypothetical protein